VQAGSLEDLRNKTPRQEYWFLEPYPELIVSPDDSGEPVFFHVVDPNPVP
jgi:hypothetical protein